jgi:hypothetical protein
MILLSACGGSGQAETIAVECEANQSWQSPAMTMVYEGADSGTLTVKGEFGEMSLPARKLTREGPDEKGGTRTVVNLVGAGPAKVIMPDKKAAEECAKGKLPGDQAQDKDIVFVTMMGCLASVPKGTEPVDINAHASISLLDPPDMFVEFTRTYVEPSTLPGGEPIKVEAFPTCKLTQ